MKNIRVLVIGLMLAITTISVPARADVQIVRGDSENPFVSVSKSTLYGALTGTVVALAAMLVVNGDDGDIFKWSFVAGTAAGLGYGIFHVATRPSNLSSNALFQFDGGGLKQVAIPTPTLNVKNPGERSVQVPMFAYRF